MPFVSKAQQRFLYARHPEIAKRWQREYGTPKKLPEKKNINERIKKSMKIVILFILASWIASLSFAMDAREISDGIVEGCSTDEQKICALREAVYNQMKPGKYPLEEVLQMSPQERWEKGVGWCNHQVEVFMYLAREQAFSTRMIYLLTEDMSTSPHTIAQVKLGNRWVVVDVGNNIEFRNKYGELATVNDMVADFTIISENERVKELKGEFPSKVEMKYFLNPSYLVKEIEP